MTENRVSLLVDIKQRIRRLKAETLVLYFAARHPATPWYAKLLVAGIVAYALSPIDLIPDFVPVLGYLDDLILIPLAIAVAIKMIPEPVLNECRARAGAITEGRPTSYAAAVIIVIIWLGLAAWGLIWAYERYA